MTQPPAPVTHRLPDRRGLLVVSLPANDVDLARAALDNGADVIKCHVNLTHASGRAFGTLADNRRAFDEIIGLGKPVGLVPGAHDAMLTEQELRQADEMGFAFYNADISAAPPYLTRSRGDFVPSIGGDRPDMFPEWLPFLTAYPGDWIEASAVPLAGHRQPLRLQELLGLRHVAQLTERRIIVPSVRSLVPNDVAYLFDIPHVWAIMIGSYVTGHTHDGLGRATRQFRAALDTATGAGATSRVR